MNATIRNLDAEATLLCKRFPISSTNFAARALAQKFGIMYFIIDGRVYLDTDDGIASVYWLNRKHTMLTVREAACPEVC